jgi:hypothetical protein
MDKQARKRTRLGAASVCPARSNPCASASGRASSARTDAPGPQPHAFARSPPLDPTARTRSPRRVIKQARKRARLGAASVCPARSNPCASASGRASSARTDAPGPRPHAFARSPPLDPTVRTRSPRRVIKQARKRARLGAASVCHARNYPCASAQTSKQLTGYLRTTDRWRYTKKKLSHLSPERAPRRQRC